MDAERARELINYNPETGSMVWRLTRGRAVSGEIATYVRHDGYATLRMDRKHYYAHRVAWLVIHGSWPKCQIDHINGVRNDNRLENLRESNQSENLQNMGKRVGVSKYTGVHLCRKTGKWISEIRHKKKKHYLGRFENEADAYQAYLEAKKSLHEFNPIPRSMEACE